jgi:hypothetical protein
MQMVTRLPSTSVEPVGPTGCFSETEKLGDGFGSSFGNILKFAFELKNML